MEWPNYIKTYMHFFAACLQACTMYMHNSPHTRLYCYTRIWGKPNHLGHQICRWVQTDHKCTKMSVWTFFICKRIQIWSCYDLRLYLSTTQHPECVSVEDMQIWVETVHTHKIFLVCQKYTIAIVWNFQIVCWMCCNQNAYWWKLSTRTGRY